MRLHVPDRPTRGNNRSNYYCTECRQPCHPDYLCKHCKDEKALLQELGGTGAYQEEGGHQPST